MCQTWKIFQLPCAVGQIGVGRPLWLLLLLLWIEPFTKYPWFSSFCQV